MIIRLGKKTYHFINNNEFLRQPVVYLFVGGSSALADLILLFVLVDLFNVYYLLAASVSFTLVSTVAFFFHKNYTFRHKRKNNKLRYLIFLITAVSGLLWSIFFLYMFVSVFNLHYLSAAIITKFVVLIWNFSVNKFITFGHLGKIVLDRPKLRGNYDKL